MPYVVLTFVFDFSIDLSSFLYLCNLSRNPISVNPSHNEVMKLGFGTFAVSGRVGQEVVSEPDVNQTPADQWRAILQTDASFKNNSAFMALTLCA